MQQDAEQDQVSGMTASVNPTNRLALLRGLKEFEQASNSSIQHLAEAAELVELRQGQTLLRASTLETHAFVVIEGALRLLAKEPFHSDLFSVGRAEAGQLVGVVGLLRQSPCEGAIARRPTQLISLPLELLNTLIKDDHDLETGLQPLVGSKAAVLSEYLHTLPHPPADPCQWILAQLSNSAPEAKQSEQTKQLLSTVLPEHAELTGTTLNPTTRGSQPPSPLPLDFGPGLPLKS